jgi:hypothetical protein
MMANRNDDYESEGILVLEHSTGLSDRTHQNMRTQAKAWARFARPFLLRRPGYGGQVGPKRAERQPATRNP